MIPRCLYILSKPSRIERDHRGTLIEPGLRVAYNKSGDVTIGTILVIIKNDWKNSNGRWHLQFEMIVTGEDGGASKIKNPNSFVII